MTIAPSDLARASAAPVLATGGLRTLDLTTSRCFDIALDAAKFDTCLTSDAAVTAVQNDLKTANELALPGTPSFVINGKVTPTPESIADWRKLLDGLLK